MASLLFDFSNGASASARQREIWFCPAPGSLDLLELFEREEEWSRARSKIQVFKFYQANLFDGIQFPLTGPNHLEALRTVAAFRKLHDAGVAIGAEVGAVKPQYCSADAKADVRVAIQDTISVCRSVLEAGGTIDYLALDEPFFAAAAFWQCEDRFHSLPVMRAMERLRPYVSDVRSWHFRLGLPVRIGLIEPYPFFERETICGFVRAMARQDIAPDFFHLDVELSAVNNVAGLNLLDDLRRFDSFFTEEGIRFGIILWGNDGVSDARYFDSAMRLVLAVRDAFGEDFPDLIFQSWVPSPRGRLITPNNLPEDRPYSHTFLINHAIGCLEAGACSL